MEGFEHDIVKDMMVLISTARDCSPVLSAAPEAQEKIIEACKASAKTVFNFKDVMASHSYPPNINTAFIHQSLNQLEAQSNDLTNKVLKETEIALLNHELANVMQESSTQVNRTLSLFRIFLGKLRIASGLNVMNRLSEGDSLHDIVNGRQQQQQQQQHHQQQEQYNSGHYPSQQQVGNNTSATQQRKSFEDDDVPLNADAHYYINNWVEQLKSQGFKQHPPHDVSIARSQLANVPQWIVDRLADEHSMRIDMQKKLISMKSRLDFEKNNFEDWKRKVVETFRASMKNANEQNQGNDEKQQSVATAIAFKNHELREKDIKIEELEKTLIEVEQRYHGIKETLSKYQIEVEDWKRDTTEKFAKHLAEKDREIKELQATIEMAIHRDETKEQEELMNQLLEFIDNSKPAAAANTAAASTNETTTQEERSSDDSNTVSTTSSAPDVVAAAVVVADVPASPSVELLSSPPIGRPVSVWKPAKKPFKVMMPHGLPTITLDYKEQMTLGEVLDEIEAVIKDDSPIKNLSEYHFFHLEQPVNTPPLKLTYRLGTLNSVTVKLARISGEDSNNNNNNNNNSAASNNNNNSTSTSSLSSSSASTAPTDTLSENNTVEDLIKMMEKSVIDKEIEEDTTVALVCACPGFDIELGSKDQPKIEDTPTKTLVDSDKNTPYYSHYFKHKPHINFYAEAGNRMGPVLVSLENIQKEQMEAYQDQSLKLRALVRTKFDDEWVFISADSHKSKLKKGLLKAIETTCRHGDKLAGLKLKEISSPDGPKELAIMEEKLLTKGYKFGVLYVRAGQTDEDLMFGNVETSPEYEEFLKFLGDRVQLQGWDGYRGGLDVKNNSTGTHSIFTKHLGYSVMFHVSTLLPFYPNDKQQLERKRHLGNDVCVIVFKDSEEPFAPDTIKSEFNHVFAVICKEKSHTDKIHYRLSFAYKGGVGMAKPLLPHPAVYEANQTFRDFLLTKLINSERCAMYAPNFVNKIAKTKELQMQAVIDAYKKGEF